MTVRPTRHEFRSQGLRLNYLDWGNADAPTLIFLHGGRDHALSWSRIAAQFADDWHVVAPDLRGHGDSEHVPTGHYAMEDFTLDFAVFAERFDGPLSIVGHSLGGNISLRFTGLYPDRVRRLVNIEGLGYAPDLQAREDAKPMDERLREWFAKQSADGETRIRRFPSVDAAAQRMMQNNPHVEPALARELIEQGAHVDADGSLVMKFDPRMRVLSPVDITTAQKKELWRRVTCPVLLVYGAESWTSDPVADGRAAEFKDARRIMFDRAGHWSHHDRRDDFVTELRAFLP